MIYQVNNQYTVYIIHCVVIQGIEYGSRLLGIITEWKIYKTNVY